MTELNKLSNEKLLELFADSVSALDVVSDEYEEVVKEMEEAKKELLRRLNA